MTQQERQAIRQALDGAMLNVAMYAASLHVGRRILVNIGEDGQYRIRYAGLNWSLLVTPSLPEVVTFLDGLGIPGKRASLGVAA